MKQQFVLKPLDYT